MTSPPELFPISARTKFLVLVGFMIASIAALPGMPLLLPWGADLHNVHVYAQCAHGKSPYSIDGKDCGDLWARPFFYPPFLFHFFGWTRTLTLKTLMYIWTAFLYVGTAATFLVWDRWIGRHPRDAERSDRHEVVVFCALLMFQYPFVFALERGNTDTVTVVLYTLAAYLMVRRRLWLSGAAAGLAAGFKLSPTIAVVTMVGALLLVARRPIRGIGKWGWFKFGAGALGAFAVTLLIFFKESVVYLRDVLPGYAKAFTFVSEFGHSVPTYVGAQYPGFATIMAVCLVGVWCWAGARAIARGEQAWALAGALAISTYNQRTSFDYNLVTTYPLLLLLFLRARRTNRWALLAFGVFAIAGDRRLFTMPNAHLLTAQLHLTLQLAFLAITALVVARGDEPTAAAVTADPTADGAATAGDATSGETGASAPA